MQLTGVATDPLGLSDTEVETVTPSGTVLHTIKSSFFKNRSNWGNAITEDQQGPQADPDIYIEATSQNLGFVAVVQRDARTTGMRFYKMTGSSGVFTVGCWNSAGTLLASKSVTLSTSDNAWITVTFDSPVNLVGGETYYWGYNYPLTDGNWAWTSFAWNAQDNYVYPLHVPSYGVTGAGVKTGGSWRKAGTFGVSVAAVDRQPHNYYVDPLVEWDLERPTYESGLSYWDQFPNGGPRKAFPIGIYWADPPFIQEYADMGINTYWAGSVSDDYRDAIVAADMDWYPSLHGNDMSAPKRVQEDPPLAAVVRGYMITDEPDLNAPYNSPDVLREWRNNCRRIDSTRPVNLNLSRFTMMNQGFFGQPPSQTIKTYNENARKYMSLVDWCSLDAYGIAHTDPFSYNGNTYNRYGIWWYPMQIGRLRDEITDHRIPVHGIVETTSHYADSPTPDQVKRTVWSMLIAGAKGINYFDHRFASPAVTQDFAAMLHDPPMKSAIQALNTQIISLSSALLAEDANFIKSYTSTGTMTKTRGGYADGAKVPMHYTSRVVGGTTYFFVQAIRDGATTATMFVPGFEGATLTVIGESRTVSVNGSGFFTDTFVNGDYEYHLYSTTATPTFSAPANTVAPAITGTAEIGETVSSSTGTWTGVPTPTFAYQWRRNGSNILSATTASYTIQAEDEGDSIDCRVTATNSQGSASVNSNSITPVAASASAYAAAVLVDNPTGYWRLSDYSDSSGNAHTLTLGAGSITPVASLITDLSDGAQAFDASGNSYLAAADASDLRATASYSVEAWIKPAVSSDLMIVVKPADFILEQRTSGVFRFKVFAASWYVDIDTVSTYSVGSTHHIVGTWDATAKLIKVYFDGLLDHTIDASSFGYPGPNTSGWGDLHLGNHTALGGVGYASGVLDEVAVYQGALSAGRVAAHYAAGIA